MKKEKYPRFAARSLRLASIWAASRSSSAFCAKRFAMRILASSISPASPACPPKKLSKPSVLAFFSATKKQTQSPKSNVAPPLHVIHYICHLQKPPNNTKYHHMNRIKYIKEPFYSVIVFTLFSIIQVDKNK